MESFLRPSIFTALDINSRNDKLSSSLTGYQVASVCYFLNYYKVAYVMVISERKIGLSLHCNLIERTTYPLEFCFELK